jgi:hypothetical protein
MSVAIPPTIITAATYRRRQRFRRRIKRPQKPQRFPGSSPARPTGLEPATTGSTVRYSNQLSYGPSATVQAVNSNALFAGRKGLGVWMFCHLISRKTRPGKRLGVSRGGADLVSYGCLVDCVCARRLRLPTVALRLKPGELARKRGSGLAARRFVGETSMPYPIWRVVNVITCYAGQLDRQQWVVISFLVLGLGLLTLRGFGSRSNY